MSDDGPQFDEDESQEPLTPVTNAADVPAIRRQRDTQSRRRREAARFWRGILGDKVGRREIYGLLTNLHAFDLPFHVTAGLQPDPLASYLLAGEHRGGFRFYLSLMAYDPVAMNLMLQENDPVMAAAILAAKRGR